MQHDQKFVRETFVAPVARPQGPVELDPAFFALVSGGSPRNGWPAPTTEATTSTTTDTAASSSGWL